METRQLKAIAAVVLVSAVAFGVWRWRSTSGEQVSQEVETVTVAKGTVEPILAVTGAVAADQRAVNSASSGRIVEMYVKQGDTVSAGQKLFRLDGTGAQQDINIAWANLQSAKAKLQDLTDKSAPAADVAAQNATVAKANADYQKADEAREALTVTAPIDGTVISISANVGEQSGGSSAGSGISGSGGSSGVVTVADLSKLYMKASVGQADISKVNLDQQAKITLDALPGKDFTGKITSIDPVPTTNQNVVTYNVNISLDQSDPGIRMGMSANISIDLGKRDGVLVVPNIAIHSQGADKTVNKMIDGQSTAVTIETGAADGQNTEITSGLSVGDKIVLQSFQSTGGRPATTGGSGGNAFGGGFGGGFGGAGRGLRGN